MRKIILQNTSTEEKQEYENTWGKRKKNAHSPRKLIKSNNMGKKRRKNKTKNLFWIWHYKLRKKIKSNWQFDQINFSILSQKKY